MVVKVRTAEDAHERLCWETVALSTVHDKKNTVSLQNREFGSRKPFESQAGREAAYNIVC